MFYYSYPKQNKHSSEFPYAYSADYNSKQRGVVILISKKIHFTCSDTTMDPEGRYLIVNITAKNTELFIGNS